MKQQRTKRNWATKYFNPGTTDTIDLPLGFDLESLQLYFSAAFTNSVAWTAIKTEGLSKLIRRLEILHNGATIWTTTMDMVVGGNWSRKGGVIRVNPLATAAAQTGEAVGFIDFANIGALRPKDSLLVTAGSRQLQLRVTWGQWTDMYTGAGTVSAGYSLPLTVSVAETQEYGDGQGGRTFPEFKRYGRFIEKTYSANQVDRIPLDPDLLYRGIVLRTELGSTGDLSTAVLNSIQVQIGTNVPINLPAQMVEDANTEDNGWTMPGGFYVVDFSPAPGGLSKISDFLDTTGHNNDAFLILDVNGNAGTPNKVQIMSHQFAVDQVAAQHNKDYRAANGKK